MSAPRIQHREPSSIGRVLTMQSWITEQGRWRVEYTIDGIDGEIEAATPEEAEALFRIARNAPRAPVKDAP